MREPRIGVEWSPKRAAIRQAYGGYMSSPAWYKRRRRWLSEFRKAAGEDPACTVCGEAWRLSHDDLHHRSYRRLGHEDFRDLVPMCRSCHNRLHVLLDRNPEWKHFRHEQATDMLINYLRKEATKYVATCNLFLAGSMPDEELEPYDYDEPGEADDEEPEDSPPTPLGHARRGHLEPDAREVFAALMGSGAEAEAPEPPGPTDWRAIPPDEAPEAWEELRAWVEELVRRYPSFDHHVVPACWYRHNSHVEALVALRDYERLAFFPSSPASSPYNYEIALAQIEARLREWTARAGCLGEHREQPPGLVPPTPDEWAAWVAQDQDFRKQVSDQEVREPDPER